MHNCELYKTFATRTERRIVLSWRKKSGLFDLIARSLSV